MLVVVISIFLITEIPAAIIFIIHVLSVSLSISIIDYRLINILLIVRLVLTFYDFLNTFCRNVLIVSSYPFRFAIYCGMSQQFRDVVKQVRLGESFMKSWHLDGIHTWMMRMNTDTLGHAKIFILGLESLKNDVRDIKKILFLVCRKFVFRCSLAAFSLSLLEIRITLQLWYWFMWRKTAMTGGSYFD